MTVTDSPDALGPYTVSFTAAADVPESVSEPQIVFASVHRTATKTVSITVSNHATSGPITLSGTSIGGANAGDFAVTGGTCTGTLAAASSCTYAVSFTPASRRLRAGRC